MVSEKQLVSSALTAKNNSTSSFSYYSSNNQPIWISSQKIDDYQGVLELDFRFDFSFFVSLALVYLLLFCIYLVVYLRLLACKICLLSSSPT